MNVKFDEKGLVVAIAQDAYTGEILMQAYMDEEALAKTMESGVMHYHSRSRNCLWKKGETGGNIQRVIAAYIDCDGDSLLFKIDQVGGVACHTGNRSCFYTEIMEHRGGDFAVIHEDTRTIADRKKHPIDGSYTNYLFNKGTDKICKKIAEEAGEVIIAAKNKDKKELAMELSDLLYHAQVLMENEGLTPEDIYLVAMERQGVAPNPKYKG